MKGLQQGSEIKAWLECQVEQACADCQDDPIDRPPGAGLIEIAIGLVQPVTTSQQGVADLAGAADHNSYHGNGNTTQIAQSSDKTAWASVDRARKLSLVDGH